MASGDNPNIARGVDGVRTIASLQIGVTTNV
jgi:hypothetical protein